jgi:hypothetical protein
MVNEGITISPHDVAAVILAFAERPVSSKACAAAAGASHVIELCHNILWLTATPDTKP